MTNTSTLGTGGRVTIPRKIRNRLGLKPGDQLTFALLPDAILILRPKIHHIEDLVGILHRPGQPWVPIEEMRVELPDGNIDLP